MADTIVSVVTIARNNLDGLRRTVASVDAQVGVEIELIIIDGGSTDGTRCYLEESCSRYYWSSRADRGRYDAMNIGAEKASGDLLWFLHSGDTFFRPDSASTAVRLLGEADWGYGLSQIWRNGRPVAVGGRLAFDSSRFLLGREIIPHQASLMKRSFFERLGAYSVEFGLAEDQRFFMKALHASLPRVIPEFLCIFDGDGAGSTRGPWAHVRDFDRARRAEACYVYGAGVDWALGVVLGVELGARSQVRRLRAR